MSNSAALLRLLEPAVRPSGPPAVAKSPTPPIEARDFEALLSETRIADAEATRDTATASDIESSNKIVDNLVRQLAQFDRIDNAALRGLIADATRNAAAPPTAGE